MLHLTIRPTYLPHNSAYRRILVFYFSPESSIRQDAIQYGLDAETGHHRYDSLLPIPNVLSLINIVPVVQGGMQWVGYAELAAAVSNAGGLGIVLISTYNNYDGTNN